MILRGGEPGTLSGKVAGGGDVFVYGGADGGGTGVGDIILAHTGSFARGRVGIGTTSPTVRLDIESSQGDDGIDINNTSVTGDSRIRFQLSGTSTFSMGVDDSDDDKFKLSNSGALGTNTRLTVTTAGNVGIGTTNPGTFKLAVNGTIRAKEVKVETGWSDFVFEEDYELMSIAELEQSIKQDGHLPGIPSAEEVAANGVNVGEMQAKLLQKIEELTLYVIDLKKDNEALEERVVALEQ